MKCPNCGAETNSMTCEYCGTQLPGEGQAAQTNAEQSAGAAAPETAQQGNVYTGSSNPYNAYNTYAQPEVEQKGKSIASLVLGLVGLLAWCIPLFGFPVTITGFVLGILGMKKGGKGMAIAGIILCVITFLLTLVNSALGAYLGATGQMPY